MYYSVFKGEDFFSPHFVPDKKNIAPLVGAALIGAAGTVAGGMLSGIASSEAGARSVEAQRLANEANIQMVRETNQANYDLYKEQLKDLYEQPSKQVTALRNAGLNPAMAYGGVSSMPSAPTMQSAQVQPAPYEAYNDSFMNGLLASLPVISESLQGIQDFAGKSVDNQVRDAYNKKSLENLDADIQNKLSDIVSKGVTNDKTRAEIFKLKSDKEAVDFLNKLNNQTYENSLKLSDLSVKAQELQNRVLDEQNSRDAVRLAIEQYEAATHRKMTNAQVSNLNVMSRIAQNVDFRDTESHNAKMMMETLDRQLKHMEISETEKQNLFNTVMRESVMNKQRRVDSSALNHFAEEAIGFGFNDLGHSIQNFLRLGK